MKRQLSLIVALSLACGMPVVMNSNMFTNGFTAVAQSQKATGTVTDANGEPLIGATVMVKGTNTGATTDLDGNFSVNAKPGSTLMFSYVGYTTKEVKYTGTPLNVVLTNSTKELDEVVVTALGIKKERKSLGYAIDDINAEELMKNKTSNAVNSLSGKIAGVNITQAGGAPGAGAQIILRGGTSLERDNQPLFVVDGVIYDNSTTIAGNSAFDGTQAASTTSSNRVMDINPEDIENMSVLKGPAAAALYGSRAANGVVIITTKKGQEGNVEVNLSAKYITQWATNLPESQKKYGHGFWEDQYDGTGAYTGTNYNDFSFNSWGKEIDGQVYDNIGDFFSTGGAWDTNVSVSGGSKNNSFYLSGSYYDQDGIIPTTGYTKATFRFNGEQKWKIFTFGANVAYSQANTDKTLTSAGLYGNAGTGALQGVFSWAPDMDMTHYLADDGTRYRVFGDRLNPWDDKTNPYWILNKNKISDNTERFTGNFSIKADITDWWWISYRMGIDSYLFSDQKTIGAGGTNKEEWQNGMFAQNDYRHQYVSTNLMTNFNKTFGDFGFNLLLGLTTDDTKTWSNYRMAWNFTVPEFYSFSNATENNKKFQSSRTQKRLVGVYGEFRADWRNTVFVTVTGRNDWTSTLPLNNRSYFYPSFSGSVVFTEFLPKLDWLSFGRVRASWARVGKDTGAYQLDTSAWPVQQYLGGFDGTAAYWQSGNAYLKPEISESTEVGLEMRFFNNRLKFDYAFYTNNSYNQIMTPRLSNATGYILRSVNAGDVYNKGMELSIGGTAIQTKDWTWETSINMAGNRGTVKNLMQGVDVLYVTDVQVGTTQACSYPNGNFMSLNGYHWQYDDNGNVVLDPANKMPLKAKDRVYVANREPKFTGGWNNNLSWKDWSFSMLWEFRVGGSVYNGTQYAMTHAGISKLTENRESLTISGVYNEGTTKEPKYSAVETTTYEADKTYTYNGKTVSGRWLINNYYSDYYLYESNNWIKKVNSLRLRSISLSYSVPKAALAKTKVIKRAIITASASNILLFTNYDGDPEVAVAGSGRTGSSSVGIDYCGVPSTASFAFGVNLTF